VYRQKAEFFVETQTKISLSKNRFKLTPKISALLPSMSEQHKPDFNFIVVGKILIQAVTIVYRYIPYSGYWFKVM